MEKNKKYAKVKHPAQLYKKYLFSLEHHCVMDWLIFSIETKQVENDRDLSIAGVFSREMSKGVELSYELYYTF